MNTRPALEPWHDRVHNALVHASDEALPNAAAPSADQIWQAVHGELDSREAQAVVDAALLDPAAYAELRLALAVSREMATLEASDAGNEAKDAPKQRSWRGLSLGIAAAAALLAAVSLRPRPQPPSAPSRANYRAADPGQVKSALAHEASVDRDHFILEWEPVAGAHYTVSVSTQSARLLAHRRGLKEPRLVLPPTTLSSVASGSRILWRVEAVREDGSKDNSATFVVVLR